jgi:hypothetical protein
MHTGYVTAVTLLATMSALYNTACHQPIGKNIICMVNLESLHQKREIEVVGPYYDGSR